VVTAAPKLYVINEAVLNVSANLNSLTTPSTRTGYAGAPMATGELGRKVPPLFSLFWGSLCGHGRIVAKKVGQNGGLAA
jgi:hypothetical protein